jgi:hypothetical protein
VVIQFHHCHPGVACNPYGRTYDITPDGERFVMEKSMDPPPRKIAVVLNWFAELKRLCAVKK